MEKHIQAPLNREEIKNLKSGDYVYITGTIYTARDAAHKRMYEALQNGEQLPIDVENQIIYYNLSLSDKLNSVGSVISVREKYNSV